MAIKSKARHDLTLCSIKREIAAGRDVAYWLDKVYTHLGNGLLTEDDIAEVEQLARAYYDALDAEDSAIDAPDDVTQNVNKLVTFCHRFASIGNMVRNAGQLPQPFWIGAACDGGSCSAARCAART